MAVDEDRLAYFASEIVRAQLAPMSQAVLENAKKFGDVADKIAQAAVDLREDRRPYPEPGVRRRPIDTANPANPMPFALMAGVAGKEGTEGLLRKLFADMDAKKKDDEKGKDDGKGGAGDRIAALIREPFRQLSAVLAPMSVMASVIGSNASGFQLVGSAMRVLAATLAPLLLPVFVIVATALTAISDILWEKIEPSLDDFYGWIMSKAIPALEAMVQSFLGLVDLFGRGIHLVEDLWDALRRFVGWVSGSLPGAKATGGGTGSGPAGTGTVGGAAGLALGVMSPGTAIGMGADLLHEAATGGGGELGGVIGQLEEISRQQAAAKQQGPDWADAYRQMRGLTAPNGGPPVLSRADQYRQAFGGEAGPAAPAAAPAANQEKTPRDRVRDSLRDVLTELRTSLGPKASFSGLTDVGRQIQLAALNQSPFETKILERVTKMLDAMERVAANTTQQPRLPDPGRRGGAG